MPGHHADFGGRDFLEADPQVADLGAGRVKADIESVGVDLDLLAGDDIPAADVAEMVIDDMPDLLEEPPVVDLVEIAEEPAPKANIDDVTLDGDLFEALINETEGEGAAGEAALAEDDALFPFEYYSIKFLTFAAYPYSQNRGSSSQQHS